MTSRAPRLCAVSPLIPVADLERSIRFFTETLGFKLGFQADSYA